LRCAAGEEERGGAVGRWEESWVRRVRAVAVVDDGGGGSSGEPIVRMLRR